MCEVVRIYSTPVIGCRSCPGCFTDGSNKWTCDKTGKTIKEEDVNGFPKWCPLPIKSEYEVEKALCPYCKSEDHIVFDSNNWLCKNCGKYFPF